MRIELQKQCPLLFSGTLRWGNTAPTGVRLTLDDYGIDRLQGVLMVPWIGNDVVLIRDSNGYHLPGGTMERDEDVIDTARRELMEESGCVLDTCHPAFIISFHSFDLEPWRPWFAHPDFEKLVCISDVTQIAEPTNPSNAEQMEAIEIFPIQDAIARLEKSGRPDIGEVYGLADHLRATGLFDPDLLAIN